MVRRDKRMIGEPADALRAIAHHRLRNLWRSSQELTAVGHMRSVGCDAPVGEWGTWLYTDATRQQIERLLALLNVETSDDA